MNTTSLKVLNFRCIESAEFAFDPNMNLIIGANGSGKTALLAALSTALIPAVARLGGKGTLDPLPASEARVVSELIRGQVRFEAKYPITVDAHGEIFGKEVDWTVHRESPTGTSESNGDLYSVLQPRMKQLGTAAPFVIPLVAFYGARRNSSSREISLGEAAEARISRQDAFESWRDALIDRTGLTKWVIGKTLEELQALSENPEGLRGYLNDVNELSIVNRALRDAIPNARGLKYDLRLRSMLVLFGDGSALPFRDLSEGQQSLIALVADIARRMCVLNPHLGELVLEQSEGIIGIDELDIHLHPKWQRHIVRLLASSFPKIQFFASSHSPQMVSELSPSQVMILQNGKPMKPETTFGLDASSILEEIMGATARDPSIDLRLTELFRGIELGDLVKATEALNELKRIAPRLPEYVRAEALIKRKELLGR